MSCLKRFATALLTGFFFLLTLASCGKAEEIPMSEEELIEELRQPTVMITVGGFRATGVIIGNDNDGITIATVYHLMEGYDQGIVTFYGGKTGFADACYSSSENDICLLKIKREDMTPEFIDSLKYAKTDVNKYESLEKGDKIYLVGSQVGVAANAVTGTFQAKDYYVPEFDQYLMYLYADVNEGMSGSGLYTEDGYLVGLLAGGSDASEAVCIPITDVINAASAAR